MEKIVVIGDVHGLCAWEQIIEKHPDCKYVFLGDYNDPYGHAITDEEVMDNFRRLIDFKLAHMDDVVLLLGNHDMHYVDVELAPLCTRFNVELSFDLMVLFDEYRHCFQYAHQIGNLLFTHAGVSEEWFTESFCSDDRSNIAIQLNHCERNQEEALHHCGVSRGGDHVYGGICWADKKEFAHPLEGYVQVVGHNRVQQIEEWEGENGARVWFCDSLHRNNYLTILVDESDEMTFTPLTIE